MERSSIGSMRWPVKPKVVGSSPTVPAILANQTTAQDFPVNRRILYIGKPSGLYWAQTDFVAGVLSVITFEITHNWFSFCV